MNNPVSNSFSFARIGLLWNYYSRWIYLQAAIYAAITVLVYIVSFLAADHEIFFLLLGSTGQTVLAGMIYLGALVFAIPSDRQGEIMLPASVAEKATFYIGYTFIVVPAFILAVWWLCIGVGCIFSANGNVQELYSGLLTDITSESGLNADSLHTSVLNVLTGTVLCAGTLFAVIAARRQRVLWGIAGAAAAYFLETLISIGVVAAVLVPFFRSIFDNPDMASDAINTEISTSIYSALPIVSVTCFAIAVVLVLLTVRMLYRRTA